MRKLSEKSFREKGSFVIKKIERLIRWRWAPREKKYGPKKGNLESGPKFAPSLTKLTSTDDSTASQSLTPH
jgi:hypothetical protein